MVMNDEQAGTKYRIATIFGNSYLYVSGNDIMLTIADENQREQAQLRATTEAICRISSKAMKHGLPMSDIIEQLKKADSGRCTILTDIAQKMEEFCGKNNVKMV
jgi:hypothetical protein